MYLSLLKRLSIEFPLISGSTAIGTATGVAVTFILSAIDSIADAIFSRSSWSLFSWRSAKSGRRGFGDGFSASSKVFSASKSSSSTSGSGFGTGFFFGLGTSSKISSTSSSGSSSYSGSDFFFGSGFLGSGSSSSFSSSTSQPSSRDTALLSFIGPWKSSSFSKTGTTSSSRNGAVPLLNGFCAKKSSALVLSSTRFVPSSSISSGETRSSRVWVYFSLSVASISSSRRPSSKIMSSVISSCCKVSNPLSKGILSSAGFTISLSWFSSSSEVTSGSSPAISEASTVSSPSHTTLSSF